MIAANDTQVVRTRMAPSPTGEMHVGSLATLLKNYAFARKHGGSFILRIEDTDKVREVPGAVQRIQSVITAYGLDWDEGPGVGGPHSPYLQSERLDTYKQAAENLVKSDKAYYCFCSEERLTAVNDQLKAQKLPPMYDRHCRNLTAEEVQTKLAAGAESVIRLKVPDDQQITFTDWIRGEITIPSNSVNDQVLLKSDGFPTYHLAVVVDDHEMEITHIMRGEEWISSTPKHILLYDAFNWPKPVYAHIPVFLNPDGQGKMSKRKGDVSAQSFLDRGYLPEAMLNFFMILGWTPQDQREILTLSEYIAEFDPRDLSAKSVVFDLQKLDWLNGVYIRQLSETELWQRLTPFIPADFPQEKSSQILALVRERLTTLADFEGLTYFFYRPAKPSLELLLKKVEPALVTSQLNQLRDKMSELTSWTVPAIEAACRTLQEEQLWKKSQFFMLIRVAVTGEDKTPPLFETMAVIDQTTIIERLNQSLLLIPT